MWRLVRFVRSACLVRSASTLFPRLDLPKTAKMQFSRMSFIPLQEFLQNCMNSSHANGLKAKIG